METDGVFGTVKAAGLDSISDAGAMTTALLGAGMALRLGVRWVKRAVGMS